MQSIINQDAIHQNALNATDSGRSSRGTKSKMMEVENAKLELKGIAHGYLWTSYAVLSGILVHSNWYDEN